MCGSRKYYSNDFAALRAKVAGGLASELRAMTPVLVEVLNEWRAAKAAESSMPASFKAHLDSLVFPGFVTAEGVNRLRPLVRYLGAAVVRAESYPTNPGRDADNDALLQDLEADFRDLAESLPARRDVAVAMLGNGSRTQKASVASRRA